MTLLAHGYDKLVHYAAADSDEVVLGLLSDQGYVLIAYVEVEKDFQEIAREDLNAGRGRESAAVRDVAEICNVEAFVDVVFSEFQGVNYAQRIVCKALGFVVFGVVDIALDYTGLREVCRIETAFCVIPFSDCGIGADSQGAREDMPTVVVGVLTYQVYSAGRKEYPCAVRITVCGFESLKDLLFHCFVLCHLILP